VEPLEKVDTPGMKNKRECRGTFREESLRKKKKKLRRRKRRKDSREKE